MDKNELEETLQDLFGLAGEIGIPVIRTVEIIENFLKLAKKNQSNIVIYNSITTNLYTEKERRVLFYLWGRLTN